MRSAVKGKVNHRKEDQDAQGAEEEGTLDVPVFPGQEIQFFQPFPQSGFQALRGAQQERGDEQDGNGRPGSVAAEETGHPGLQGENAQLVEVHGKREENEVKVAQKLFPAQLSRSHFQIRMEGAEQKPENPQVPHEGAGAVEQPDRKQKGREQEGAVQGAQGDQAKQVQLRYEQGSKAEGQEKFGPDAGGPHVCRLQGHEKESGGPFHPAEKAASQEESCGRDGKNVQKIEGELLQRFQRQLRDPDQIGPVSKQIDHGSSMFSFDKQLAAIFRRLLTAQAGRD